MRTRPDDPDSLRAIFARAAGLLAAPLFVGALLPFAPASRAVATASVDGTWTALQPVTQPTRREDPAAVYDPLRQRVIVFGGYGDHVTTNVPYNDLWSLSLGVAPQWAPLAAAGTPPSPRLSHSMVYDSLRDRVLVYGGGSGAPGNVVGDVWSLSLSGTPTWSQLAPTGTAPAARVAHAAIYDPVRDRMLVFGGYDGQNYLNDTWELDLAGGTPHWAQVPAVTPAGLSWRDFARAIYDPDHDRMLLCCGNAVQPNATVTPVDETWALNLAGPPTWTQLAVTGPGPRLAPAAAYDPNHHRVILFGGYGGGPGMMGDSWALDTAGNPTGWQPLTSPYPAPPPRCFTTGVYDALGDHFVVCAGANFAQYYSDAWGMDGSGSNLWTPFLGRVGRWGHTFTYDPVGHRGILFGGSSVGVGFNDAWNLDLSTLQWTGLNPSGTPPSTRTDHVAVIDVATDRLFVFGGVHGGTWLNDTWTLSLAGAPAWAPLTTTGTPPPAPLLPSGSLDTVHHRLVVIAETASNGPGEGAWALSLDPPYAWTAFTSSATQPFARQYAGLAYDAARDRFLVFGGNNGAYQFDGYDDMWELKLVGGTAQWTLLPQIMPHRNWAQGVAVDGTRGRILAFGGGTSINGVPENRVMTLPLDGSTGWSYLNSDGAVPAQNYDLGALYDPVGDRFLITDGAANGNTATTTLLNFADIPTPTLTSLVESSVDGLAVHLSWYTPAGAGTSALAGRTEDGATWKPLGTLTANGSGQVVLDDVVPGAGRWGYRLLVGPAGSATDVTWLDATAQAAFALARPSPNPAVGAAQLAFTLRGSLPAWLAVYDVRGRAVLTRDLSTLGAGSHTVSLARGALGGAGVYVVRLSEGDRALTRKLALLP